MQSFLGRVAAARCSPGDARTHTQAHERTHPDCAHTDTRAQTNTHTRTRSTGGEGAVRFEPDSAVRAVRRARFASTARLVPLIKDCRKAAVGTGPTQAGRHEQTRVACVRPPSPRTPPAANAGERPVISLRAPVFQCQQALVGAMGPDVCARHIWLATFPCGAGPRERSAGAPPPQRQCSGAVTPVR